MKPAKLTQEQKQEIKTMYQDGISVPRIATKFNISKTSVYRTIRLIEEQTQKQKTAPEVKGFRTPYNQIGSRYISRY